MGSERTRGGVRWAVDVTGGPSGEVKPGAAELGPSVLTESQGAFFPSLAKEH